VAKSQPPHNHSEIQIGGQAVIEGVVMRGRKRWALAVRRPCGEVFVTINPATTLAQKYPGWNKFLIRGIFAFVDSLVIGIKALSISGGISLEEEATEADAGGAGKAEKGGASGGTADEAEACGEDTAPEEEVRRAMAMPKAAIALSLALSIAVFLGLFIVLPAVVANLFSHRISNTVVYNLIEGGIRVGVFVGYLAGMSLLPDIRRVFQYHGAEHKVVHAYEEGLPLTPESAERFSTAHMRCGTAFIMIVLILSILVFSLMGRPALWVRVLERVAIIPLVAAISYEIIRFAGKHEDSTVMKVLMSPGLLLQKLTTRQPDRPQLEVAIEALKAAIGDEGAGAVPQEAGAVPEEA
jgi:uncharacterized protein YqhQ